MRGLVPGGSLGYGARLTEPKSRYTAAQMFFVADCPEEICSVAMYPARDVRYTDALRCVFATDRFVLIWPCLAVRSLSPAGHRFLPLAGVRRIPPTTATTTTRSPARGEGQFIGGWSARDLLDVVVVHAG